MATVREEQNTTATKGIELYNSVLEVFLALLQLKSQGKIHKNAGFPLLKFLLSSTVSSIQRHIIDGKKIGDNEDPSLLLLNSLQHDVDCSIAMQTRLESKTQRLEKKIQELKEGTKKPRKTRSSSPSDDLFVCSLFEESIPIPPGEFEAADPEIKP